MQSSEKSERFLKEIINNHKYFIDKNLLPMTNCYKVLVYSINEIKVHI